MLRLNRKIQQLASEFWSRAAIEPNYPIDNIILEQAILLSCPLSIVKINKLNFYAIFSWLNQNGFTSASNHFDVNCSLFGLLFVNKGKGFIFIDGSVSSQEQLFTLAHEVSHYILDYEQHKLQLVRTLGDDGIEILNSSREPYHHEYFKGIISGVDVKPYIHLIEKETSDTWEKMGIGKVENSADLFAMELLAPIKFVLKEINSLKISLKYPDIIQNLPVILERKYGFPVYLASRYAKFVAYGLTGGESFLDRLGY